MDLAAISAFIAVAETGGFRSAGERLGMTSSGVSKSVARLEARLGVQLFVRTTRSVRLTPVGTSFLERCRSILADLEEAEKAAAAASIIPKGRLVVSLMATGAGHSPFLKIIAEFLRAHPQVEIETRFTDRYVDLGSDGVDLAVRLGALPDSGLLARKIGEAPLILCGSPAYVEGHGRPLHPDDLRQHTFIAFVTAGTATRFRYPFMIDGSPSLADFPPQLVVDDGDALIAAALEGIGLAMMAYHLVAPLIRDGRLIRLLEDYEGPPLPINIVQVAGRHRSPAVQILAEMLAAGTVVN